MHSGILRAVCALLFVSLWRVGDLNMNNKRARKDRIRELNINFDVVQMWANKFSEEITDEVKKFTAYDAIKKKYEKFPSIEQWNPKVLVRKTAKSINRLLQSKVQAVQHLVAVAEAASKNHTFDEHLEFDYLNNKKLLSDVDLKLMNIDPEREHARNQRNLSKPAVDPNDKNQNQADDSETNYTYEETPEEANYRSDVMLVGVDGPNLMAKYRYLSTRHSPRFNNFAVNFNTSTVHVPTNVYDKNALIQNGVKWSEALNERMVLNDKQFKGLTWQYFCSSDGFFRIFPGIRWPQDNKGGNIDMFDCRVRNWYIESSSSPKNVVILVDTSGSMKGLRMEITRSTIERILETFSNKDYFNIITFNRNLTYLDSTFNGTLMQANMENRQRLAGYIRNLKTSYIARFDKALVEAFDLFEREEHKWSTVLCNKAIMLVTDGAPEGYEKIFKERNWQHDKRKPVRMFTFLIGREVSDNRNAKWMACANKGYYTHISTLADVQENVQHYLRVLSRPMVIERKRNSIWTPVYADYTTEASSDLSDGLKFITSYALPVFDTREETKYEGNLLGVIGTDVPVEQMKARIPYNKLGPNGYAFVVTAQGYVLFHPNFRPFYFKRMSQELGLKTNFSNVDITEVEHLPVALDLIKLRMKIINASSYTNYSVRNIVVPYDGRKRVSIVDFTYHINPIGKTGFKLVFAVPTKYGTTILSTNAHYGTNKLSIFKNNHTRIAPWRYCGNDDIWMADGEKRKTLLYNLFYTEKPKNCEADKMARFDIVQLRDVYSLWTSRSMYKTTKSYYASNFSVKLFGDKHGIGLIFLGTKNGITKFLDTELLSSSQEFINLNERTVDSMYYRRAVEGRIQDGYNFTFSIPLGEAYPIYENATVTISVPLEPNNRNQIGPFPLVLGMQMKYTELQRKLEKILTSCGQYRRCDLTCLNDTVNCYILDNNAYVMLSKELTDLGGFFGDAADGGVMMREMIRERVFDEVNFTDYQGMCESTDGGDDENSAEQLLNPFKKVFGALLWIFGEIALFLSEWSFKSWMSGWHQSTASPTPSDMASDADCIPFDYDVSNNPELIEMWYYHHKKAEQCKQSIKVQKPCHKNMTLYKANFRRLRSPIISGTITHCQLDCAKTYVIKWIKDTNLILVIAAAGCDCTGRQDFVPPSISEVTVEPTALQFSSRLQNQSNYNRKSYNCINADDEMVNDTRCGQCTLEVPVFLTVTCFLGAWILNTNPLPVS